MQKRERETENRIPIALLHLGLEKTRVTDAWTTLQPSGDLSGVTAAWREGHGLERQVWRWWEGVLTRGISRWEVAMVVGSEVGPQQRQHVNRLPPARAAR